MPKTGHNEKGTALMTIEIHKPELETLIRQRMESGAFQNVVPVLIEALKPTPARPANRPKAHRHS